MTLLALSILILGIYDFHFYRSLRSEPLVREPEQWPPISILTCARDARESLLRLTARCRHPQRGSFPLAPPAKAQAGTRFRTGPLLYIWIWHLAQVLFFFSIGALLLGDGHFVAAAFLVVSYVLVSTLLRYPFYKAHGKTSLLWWR